MFFCQCLHPDGMSYAICATSLERFDTGVPADWDPWMKLLCRRWRWIKSDILKNEASTLSMTNTSCFEFNIAINWESIRHFWANTDVETHFCICLRLQISIISLSPLWLVHSNHIFVFIRSHSIHNFQFFGWLNPKNQKTLMLLGYAKQTALSCHRVIHH